MKNAPPSAAPNPPSQEVTYTLKVLSSDTGDGLRTVLFRRVSDGEAIEISAETDADNLLAKLPEFLEAALEIQRALWPAQRTVSRLPSSFFPRFTEESRRVRRLAVTPDGASERHEIVRRQSLREAMIVRDIAWEALHNALGPRRRHEIDALPSQHEPPSALAESMERIAAYIERMLRSSDDAAILVACDIDAAYAASLRRHAARLREAEGTLATPEDLPKKRGLLRLIGTAYRALRTDAFMAVPQIDSWMVEARATSRPRKHAGAASA